MTLGKVLASAGLLLLAGAAGAAAPAGPQAPSSTAEPATDAAAERKICRTEKATGSLTRRTRVCLTETQWREIHDRTRRGVSEMQGSAAGGKQCVMDQGGGCR